MCVTNCNIVGFLISPLFFQNVVVIHTALRVKEEIEQIKLL